VKTKETDLGLGRPRLTWTGKGLRGVVCDSWRRVCDQGELREACVRVCVRVFVCVRVCMCM